MGSGWYSRKFEVGLTGEVSTALVVQAHIRSGKGKDTGKPTGHVWPGDGRGPAAISTNLLLEP